MKKLTHKALKKMKRRACKSEWSNLIDVNRTISFAAWLSNDFHEWHIQSPDVGELLRAWKDGRTITIKYDGKRTSCGRYEMALWLTFECFGGEETHGTERYCYNDAE